MIFPLLFSNSTGKGIGKLLSDIFYFLQSKWYPILSNIYHLLLAFTIFFIYFYSSAVNPSSFQNLVAVSDASEHSSACFLTILLFSLAYCFTLSLCEGNIFFFLDDPEKSKFLLNQNYNWFLVCGACAVWYQTLKNIVPAVGQNAVPTSQNALKWLSQEFVWCSDSYLMFNQSNGIYITLKWHSNRIDRKNINWSITTKTATIFQH